jgi:hypothetical protein
MLHRVVVDVIDNAGKILVTGNFFSSKGTDKKRTSPFINFVIGFAVGVKEVAEL